MGAKGARQAPRSAASGTRLRTEWPCSSTARGTLSSGSPLLSRILAVCPLDIRSINSLALTKVSGQTSVVMSRK